MTLPKLAVTQSGFGGRGYRNPVTGDKRIVPSITTILKAEAKDALVQWAVNQTAAYAVANVDQLLTHSPDWGYRNLRWYHTRTPDPDRADIDIHNYHEGVLNDAAEQGTWAHEWVQADVVPGLEYPDTTGTNQNHWDMVAAWDAWKGHHEIVPHFTELTVWNGEEGYAGTLDGLWEIDGKMTLLDIKTSRGVHNSAWMQIAALRNAPEAFIEREPDDYISVRNWAGPVEQTAVLHLRPSDTDHRGNYMAPFCKLIIGEDEEYHLASFRGLLQYKNAQRELQLVQREREKNAKA